MKKTRILLSIVVVFACALFGGVCFSHAEELYAPDFLWKRNIASKIAPTDVADTHLGISYRDDGTLDDKGNFTTFNRPDILLDTPGLNCSGLVLSVSRFLLNKNFSLAEASRDRRGDSGADAQLGKDWDFGLDLVLNITEGVPRRIIDSSGDKIDVNTADFSTLRGFDLQDSKAWNSALREMKPGRVYFASISKPTKKPGYRVLHYHVALILPDDKGGVWLYHATRRSSCHRINIKTAEGLRKFMGQFRDSPGDVKKILLLEAEAPGYERKPPSALAGADEAPRPAAPDTAPVDASTASKQALEILQDVGRPTRAAPLAATPSGANESDKKVAPVEQARPAQGVAPRPQEAEPNLVVNHLSGSVHRVIPELITHIPRLAEGAPDELALAFTNSGQRPRALEVFLRGPQGDAVYKGQLPPGKQDHLVGFPRDFGGPGALTSGTYLMEVGVDGAKWTSDTFEVTTPKDAKPQITSVNIPATIKAGTPFTVTITARNAGIESDYGGITVSTPEPGALRLVSAQPGKIFGAGSTVLSVTSDRIRIKAPMAERWIELWGEDKVYDMKVTLRAERPGTYPLYVRCALRSAGTKSSVILMDPQNSQAVDQQGFPAHVHTVVVR